jgi:chromosome segregation ATPase
MQAAKAEIAGHLARTTEALEKKVQEANQAADEALAELDKSETRIEALEEELKTEKKNGENYRQEAEKKEAVALQKIQDLEKRILELEQERDQLIKAGEASRTEAAKAQMQVERADRAAALAEEKMKVLEEKLTAALAANTERTRTTEAKERIEELKQELSGIKIALEEERKGRVEAEKQLAGREPGQ